MSVWSWKYWRRKTKPANINIVISTVYRRNMREGMGEPSYNTVHRPNTGRERMASMAMRGTTFFHPGWRLNVTGAKSESRAESEAAAHQATVAIRGMS